MAEGEINIDNIIQRLLEGEMSTLHFHLHLPLFLLHLMDPEIGSCAVHCNRKWSADGQEIPHLKSFIPEYTKQISNCRM